jgi:hypothetical protein
MEENTRASQIWVLHRQTGRLSQPLVTWALTVAPVSHASFSVVGGFACHLSPGFSIERLQVHMVENVTRGPLLRPCLCLPPVLCLQVDVTRRTPQRSPEKHRGQRADQPVHHGAVAAAPRAGAQRGTAGLHPQASRAGRCQASISPRVRRALAGL